MAGAQAQLELSNHEALPRANVVILGGDEVYPVAGPEAYQTKFWGPYEAALPWLDVEPPTALYAIPGNHDWYDGLTNFFRFFCQDRWLGGRLTTQKRSYFAVELAHDWWIWGIDIQLDSYIDDPQKKFFEAIARDSLAAGDKVILCTATPSWYDGPGHQGFQNLTYIQDMVLRRNARVMLSLSGDAHHYARYSSADGTHKVTAGGGGAFLHDTHSLRKELPSDGLPENERLKEEACYPDRSTSKRLALGAVSLPNRNRTFMIVPAVAYLIVGWSSQVAVQAFAESRDNTIHMSGWDDVVSGVFSNPVSILVVAVLFFGLVGFAKPPDGIPDGPIKTATRFAMGVSVQVHGLGGIHGSPVKRRVRASMAGMPFLRVVDR